MLVGATLLLGGSVGVRRGTGKGCRRGADGRTCMRALHTSLPAASAPGWAAIAMATRT